MMKQGTLIGVLLILLFIGGCGRKTPPVPPQAMGSAPVGDLTYSVDGQGVTLAWGGSDPALAGEDAGSGERFAILRAQEATADSCGGCPLVFAEIAVVPRESQGLVQYSDTGLQPGYRYVYKVRTRQGIFGAGRDSNQVSLVWRSVAQVAR